MSLYQKPLKKISVSDLEALRDEEVREDGNLDYKALWSLGDDRRKRDFLVDVSALANADGGDLIYGIEEADGLPSTIVGLENFEADKATRAAAQVLATGLDPKLTGVRFHSIALDNGNIVFIVRVPASPERPHMIRAGAAQFYSRHSALNQPMDARQLRAAILQADERGKRFSNFRAARLGAISRADHTPKLPFARAIFVHILPADDWDGFSATRIIEKMHERFRPMGRLQSMDARPNQSGAIAFETWKDEIVSSYVQLFRDGGVEAGTFLVAGGDDKRIDRDFVSIVRTALRVYIPVLHELGQRAPWTVGVTLRDVSGFTLATPGLEFLRSRPGRIAETDLVAPEQRVSDTNELDPALKAIFDYIWNACGLTGCSWFDDAGNWRTH